MAIPKLQAYALPESHDIPHNKVNWAFEPQRAALLIHDMQDHRVLSFRLMRVTPATDVIVFYRLSRPPSSEVNPHTPRDPVI